MSGLPQYSLLSPLLKACVICHLSRCLPCCFLKGESHIFPVTYLKYLLFDLACFISLASETIWVMTLSFPCCEPHIPHLLRGVFESCDSKALSSSGFQDSSSLHFRNELCYWQCLIVLQMVFEGLLTLDAVVLELWFIWALGRKMPVVLGVYPSSFDSFRKWVLQTIQHSCSC